MTVEGWVAALEVIAFVGIGVAGLFWRFYLRSYLSEKAKNLATKEDIKGITNAVEAVRSEYAAKLEDLAQQNRVLLERVKQQHDLRLVAVERRLQTHQEAYALWFKLLGARHDKKALPGIVRGAQDWYARSRLYLEPQVAEAFDKAHWAALVRASVVSSGVVSSGDPMAQDANWEPVRRLGQVIVEAVRLPVLASDRDPTGPGPG